MDRRGRAGHVVHRGGPVSRDDRPLVFLIALAAALLILGPCAHAETVKCDLTDGTTLYADMSASNVYAGEIPPSIRVWVDFSDNANLTLVSTTHISVANNKAGSEQFGQGTDANRPTVVSGGALGGRQCADFASQFLTLDSPICTGTSGEVWVAYDTDSSTTTSQALYSEANNSTTVYAVSYAIGSVSGKPAWAVSATTDVLRATNSISTDTATLTRIASSGTTTTIELNGTAETVVVTAGANDGDWFGDAGAKQRTGIGAYYHNTTTQVLNGQIGEIVVIDGATLVTWQATQLRTYLAKKWSVTVP